MKKLADMTGWEMTATLAEIAEPVGHLVNDDAFWDCFVNCTRKGVGLKQNDAFRYLLRAYAELMPLLFGAHRQDTFRILSVIEGKSIEETMQMNAMELLDDAKVAFKEVLAPFFTKSARSAKRG